MFKLWCEWGIRENWQFTSLVRELPLFAFPTPLSIPALGNDITFVLKKVTADLIDHPTYYKKTKFTALNLTPRSAASFSLQTCALSTLIMLAIMGVRNK